MNTNKDKVRCICVYCRYKVKYKCKYSYLVDYNDFAEDTAKFERVMQGGELLDMILTDLEDKHLCAYDWRDNRIVVELFNFNTGENADKVYDIDYYDEKVEGE